MAAPVSGNPLKLKLWLLGAAGIKCAHQNAFLLPVTTLPTCWRLDF